MRLTRLVCVASACLLLLGRMSPASADVFSLADPVGDNAGFNAQGDPVHGRLDIVRIELSHMGPPYADPAYLVHTIEMQDDWDSALLDPMQVVTLNVSIQHEGGNTDVTFRQGEDGSLVAPVSFYPGGYRESIPVGFAEVWRPDSRTISFAIARSQIWPEHPDLLREYEWRASTEDRRCSNAWADVVASCYDLAPDGDGGALRHVILGPGSLDCRDEADNDHDGAVDTEDAGCASADDPFEGLSDAEGDCDRAMCPDDLRMSIGIDRDETHAHPLFSGRIRTSLKACLSERFVYLYRVAKGNDPVLQRTGTGDGGRWAAFLPKERGRYYAVAIPTEKQWRGVFPPETKPRTEPIRCARIESRAVRLR